MASNLQIKVNNNDSLRWKLFENEIVTVIFR